MSRPTWRAAGFGALTLLGMAALLARAALTRSPGLNVPPWLALVLAGGVLAAALALLARAAGRERLNVGLVLPLLVAFAVTGAWIALFDDAPACTAVVAGRRMPAGSMECRIAFGGGSILTAGIAIIAARAWWAARRTARAGS